MAPVGRMCIRGAGLEACVSCILWNVAYLSRHALPKFEVAGGLVSGTEESRGIISLDRPNRQWGESVHKLLVVLKPSRLPLQLASASDHGMGWPGAIRLP